MKAEILETIGILGGNLALILVFIFRNGAQKYVDTKAENLATIEDVEKITQKVEDVKSKYLYETHAKKWIFEKQYEVLEGVWKASWELQDLARAVRPKFEEVPEDTDERMDLYRERCAKYSKSVDSFTDSVIRKKPFIPPSVYDVCESLQNSVITLKNEFGKTGTQEEYDSIDWGKISSENRKLDEIIASLNIQIRNHVFE